MSLRVERRNTLRVAGLMSGTSADGVDVAICDISSRTVTLQAFGMVAYPAQVRDLIFAQFSPKTARVDDICYLNFVLGEIFAQAVIDLCRRDRIPLESIDLIGSHGQTIHHLPQGRPWGVKRNGKNAQRSTPHAPRLIRSTLQIAEPCIIAERTGITTVADFRTRDIAAGGQGAPLVPYADWRLFGDEHVSRVLQNIGGIANVTYLPAGGGVDDVRAFDTGPGNMLMDAAVSALTRGRLTYDADGRMAASGTADEALLRELMAHPYFKRRPPKTTGREEFGLELAKAILARAKARKMPGPDLMATLATFTARSIAQAYARFLEGRVDEAILCGGGTRNQTLVTMLKQEMMRAFAGRRRPAPAVVLMDDFGISADAKEAVSFAILAWETVHGRPGNVPSATGASHRAVLGKIVPGRSL